MESQASASRDYILGPFDFIEQVLQPGGNRPWRQTQVTRVLASYDEAMKHLYTDGLAMVHDYLKDGEWIHDGSCPSDHRVYKHFIGKKRRGYGMPTLSYTEFFVIQALWAVGIDKVLDSVKRVHTMMSEHWGESITPEKSFYPRLEDSAKERTLMLGRFAVSQEETEKIVPSLSPNQRAFDKSKRIQFHREEWKRLDTVVHDLKAQDYEIVKKIREKEAQAQEHSKAIGELNDSILEDLQNANKRSLVLPPDGEQSNKRLREN
ncbi:hypothetical protein FANTH_11726 [Fusarium anthophilum]|uniref:Uncharacterized protein n=1 Tax=Fusarium anthophilum TaxID=48485 RepID=A0A8H5DTV3_9HYPO|nr:hypothetical protein FANTH_11726 [Fusarium anthophilum]